MVGKLEEYMSMNRRIKALKIGYMCLKEWEEISDERKKGEKKGEKRKFERGTMQRGKRKRNEKETKKKKGSKEKWVCSEKFDCVRSRHSAREGGGSSARWRWRVVCLAPSCPRGGVSYDKSDRLMHHVTRNPTCKQFWEQNLERLPWEPVPPGQGGEKIVDKVINIYLTLFIFSIRWQ